MKRTTPLFLFWMLLFLIASASETPSNKKRMHQLNKERKQLQGEVKHLKGLLQFQQKGLNKILKLTANSKSFSVGSIITGNISNKSLEIKMENPPRSIKINCADTNCLKMEIRKLADQKILLQKQIEESNQLIQSENDKQLQHKITNNLMSNKSIREITKADKQLYYLKEELARRQKEVFSKIKSGSYKSKLEEAKSMQQQILSKMNQNNFQLPPGYQTKSSVRKNMPTNNKGLDAKAKSELKSKMYEDIQNFAKLKDSLNHLKLKDSLWFKPNPYKTMVLRERIKFQFSWQAQKGNNYYPGRIDWMPGLQYLWTKKLQPQMAIIYRMGLGDLQHISISYQGFGIQGGMQYKIYKSALAFISYDHTYFLEPYHNAETDSKYALKPGLVLGLGLRGKIQLMFGYDFLQKYHPEKGSPWIMRFNF